MRRAPDLRWTRWTVLAPTLLAAALAPVYLVWAPASQDLAAATFRADLFARHGFAIWNNALVLRPLPALLQRPLPAARGAARRPRLTGALAVVAAAALFAILARRRFGDRGAGPVAVVRAPASRLAADRPDAVPARACRSGSARCSRSTGPPDGGDRAGGAHRPREPGRGAVRRPRRAARCARRRARARGSGAGARGGDPDRRPQSRLPDRGLRARSCSRPSSRSRCLRGGRIWLVPSEYRALRIGARALRAAGPRSCSWSTTRWAATSPGSGRCSRAPCSRWRSGPAAVWLVLAVSIPLALLAAGGAGPRRRARPPAIRLDRASPSTPRCSPSSTGSTPATVDPDPGPADQEPLGGGLRGPRAPDRARLAAPARVRGLRSVHRRGPRPPSLPRVARRPRGRLRRGRRRPLDYLPRTRWR